MKRDLIYFVTTNYRKFKEYSERIDSSIIELRQFDCELNEIQVLDINLIAEYKLEQAKKKLPGEKILVDDRGFFINAINNFPGPFVKMCLNSIGIDGILKLMEEKADRTAKFISVLGYFDGKKNHFFYDEELGFISLEKKGGNNRGWNDILYIYGYYLIKEKTIAEYSNEEWDLYLKYLEKNGDFLKKFTDHYMNNFNKNNY